MSMTLHVRRRLAIPMAYAVRFLIRHSTSPARRTALWDYARKHIDFLGFKTIAQCDGIGTLKVDSRSFQSRHLFYFGLWEPRLTSYVVDSAKEGGVFLDVGASFGYFTLLATRHFDSVISIEASPVSFRRLMETVERNGIRNVQAINCGVGEEVADLPFYRRRGRGSGDTFVYEEGAELDRLVPVAPLSELLSRVDLSPGLITFAKIDVEGFDHVVLNQILDDLASFSRLKRIAIEYDPQIDAHWRAIERARAHGFTPLLLQRDYELEYYTAPEPLRQLPALAAAPDMFCDILLART